MIPPSDPRHGTNAGYGAGCRDQCCRDAHAAYKRTLWRRRYALRVDALYIDSTGSRRRVQALLALGWTYRDINQAAGWSTSHVGGNAANVLKHSRVHLDTADRVRAAYDELSMRLPTGQYVNRQRKLAASKGYLVPLMWDDGRIDDPAYRPDHLARRNSRADDRSPDEIDQAVILRVLTGENLPTTRAEKETIMRHWLARGGSEAELCRRMNWKPGRYAPNAVERKAS